MSLKINYNNFFLEDDKKKTKSVTENFYENSQNKINKN